LTRRLLVLVVLAISLIGMVSAANYMYEKASVKGVGYKNVEMIVSTQEGFTGQKLVEKESGSGNVITERTELEGERQLNGYTPLGLNPDGTISCPWATGTKCPMDYINFTKEAEFEYMPVSYQTGTYDQKWIEKLCVQNYRIGAVLTEMYTHAEHLQKTTEVKTRGYGIDPGIKHDPEIIYDVGDTYFAPIQKDSGGTFDRLNPDWTMTSNNQDKEHPALYVVDPDETNFPYTNLVIKPGWTDPAKDRLCSPCCTGVLEANLNSNVIGVVHLGWISRDPAVNSKGRHNEWGRSVEDLTGVFSIEKFIQLWGNSTCGSISVDWLPCV
jgi:hypothetical protein